MSRLLELRIRGLGLIRDARLECAGGFGALSGETGSGKSLCISALRWVLGGRVEGDAVGEGTSVSAVFEPDPQSHQILDDLGIRVEDLLTLTREAGGSGRTSCRVNASLVSQATLRDLGDQLAEVTAQGASHRMLRRGWQRRALDDAGGSPVTQPGREMADAYATWRSAEAALAEARAATHRSSAELAEAEELIDALEPLRLRDGEEEELGRERMRLRGAAEITGAATLLAEAVSADEQGAADQVERALLELEALRGVDGELAELGAEAAAVAARLRDLGIAARRLAGRMEVDPRRLEAVEERLHELARVRRRHGSIGEALTALDDALRLRDAARGCLDLTWLEAQAGRARAQATARAGKLSTARQEAARWLEQAVESRLAVLELPQARFRITLGMVADTSGLDLGAGPMRCDGDGVDQVEFRFSSSRNGVPLPLDEGPSGGELSRLALALAAAGASDGQPLLVLDEVDTGVGGETAARVGDLLAEIGRGRQVLAVTHRPEIAARADWHLLVSRRDQAAGSVSRVDRVEADQRVSEVARMMSGRTTAAALTRAAELLAEGDPAARRRAG